ncbi:MAG TPA: zinc-binding dehydrogenase [Acidimicrobiales bacterium]|nr:zinc-binding dehydrogenase [Acidimicrobiales bacterium]
MTDTPLPTTTLQLRSLVTDDGAVQLSLEEAPLEAPTGSRVVVAVGAAPINPSDLGLLLAGADPAEATAAGTRERPIVRIALPPAAQRAARARVGESLPAGNEGAGTVVAAGPDAGHLLGRTVAVAGGAMYATHRAVDASACLVLPEGTPATAAASSFVNPMTVLGMLGTMRAEGHPALVHTAAASNLGQMLVRVCQEDGVGLVNVVRRPEQVALLRDLGAEHVVDSSADSFMGDLIEALDATKATVAFDATGGGDLGSRILTAMEAVASRGEAFSRYGSTTHKQLYIYGGLDRSPTVLTRSFGFAWSVGGWLLTPYLHKAGAAEVEAMRQRVAAGITTTFASAYSATTSLAGALDLDTLRGYARQATGGKVLITPSAR